MAIVQCPNNHYYDDKRNAVCPYCEKLHTDGGFSNGLNEQLTSYVIPVDDDDEGQMTQGYGDDVGGYERTIGVFMDEESHNQLTVGWLVCTGGPVRGKSFALNSGRNFAGSDPVMDIPLPDDMAVAQKNHFIVVYDPKSIAFYLVCGEGHTYVNGEALNDQIQLKENDEIQAGQSSFLFVPYCREGRVWE